MKSGLIVDILFPSKFASWRNNEIIFFIEEMGCDVLIFKEDCHEGVTFNLDYNFCNKQLNGKLSEYNILIFDPKYNSLNQYNKKIDGTQFNNKFKASYLITKHENFNLENYSFVYHIFLSCYNLFKRFSFDPKNQFIHLYPGGGWNGKLFQLNVLDKSVKLISSHPLTTQKLKEHGKNKFIECLNGTICNKYNQKIRKKLNQKTITVCFSSLGGGIVKGAAAYKQIAETYKKRFREDNINFISFGNCVKSESILEFPPMDYIELEKTYREKVDIYLNLETGKSFNGWPLGLEAMKEGCVSITTDANNTVKFYDLSEKPFFIENRAENFVDILKRLYEDRNLLLGKSFLGQDFVFNHCSYENQQLRIEKFIKNKIN